MEEYHFSFGVDANHVKYAGIVMASMSNERNRVMTKKQKAKLKAQILSGIVLGGSLLGSSPASAEITNSQDYDVNGVINGNLDVTDNVNVAGGHIAVVRGGTVGYWAVNLNGDVRVSANGDYALLVQGARSNKTNTLNVNMTGSHTVKIQGNVKVEEYNPGGDWGEGIVNLKLNNAQSYLAGSLAANTNNYDRAQINLYLNSNATWYVPESDVAYELSANAIRVNANGGNIDLWHATPTTVTRSNPGSRTLGFSGAGTSLNGATFIVSSNVTAGTADKVALTDASGSNTYMVKVAYDPSATEAGEYTIAGSGAMVLTSNNSGDNVLADDYTATATTSGGLLNKTLKYTPTLVVDNTGGTTVKLTKLTVTETAATDGPAALMATEASAAQLGALGAWRAENNDLQRRLGDLRWDEGSMGAWVRTYGGKSRIHSDVDSDLSYHGIQLGYDHAHTIGTGRLFTGIALSNMQGDASSSAGSSDLDSKLIGVYGSYVSKSGHFIDAIMKYGRFTNDSTHAYGGVTYAGDYGTNGLNMSVEYGYRQQLCDRFYLEPQAEINYSHMNGSSYTMRADATSGAFVANNSMDSLIARIGINAGRTTQDGNIYLKLSCLHEFDGDTGMTATYNGTTISSVSSGRDTWVEYGIGFDQRIGTRQNLYGEITRSAWADKVSDAWKANLGWRVSF